MNTFMRMMAVCMMATMCTTLSAQRGGRGGNNNHSTVNVNRSGNHGTNHGSGFSFERGGNHGSSSNHNNNRNGYLGHGNNHSSNYGHGNNHGSSYGHRGGGSHNSNVNVIVNNNVNTGYAAYGHRIPARWSHCMRHMDDGRWGYCRGGRWYYYNTYYEPDYYFAHPVTHFEAHCLGTAVAATATAVAVTALISALVH